MTRHASLVLVAAFASLAATTAFAQSTETTRAPDRADTSAAPAPSDSSAVRTPGTQPSTTTGASAAPQVRAPDAQGQTNANGNTPRPEQRVRLHSSHTVDVIAPGEKVDTILGRLRVERTPGPERDGQGPGGPGSVRGPDKGHGPGHFGPPGRPGEFGPHHDGHQDGTQQPPPPPPGR